MACLAAAGCADRLGVAGTPPRATPPPAARGDTDIRSTLREQRLPGVEWRSVRVSPREELSKLSFVDDRRGWAATESGGIYATEDGGGTWRQISDLGPDAYLSALTFTSPLEGWAAVARKNASAAGRGPQDSTILHTEDGGHSWKAQRQIEGAHVESIRFLGASEGWAVGGTLDKGAIRQDQHLLLHTDDGGGNWVDLSEKLNGPLREGGGAVQDYLFDVSASDVAKATVISADGRVFATEDGGQTWAARKGLEGERLAFHFISAPGRLSLIGGQGGRHGIFSALAVGNGDANWTKYQLTGVYLRDAAYLSENEVVACGVMPSKDDEPLDEGAPGVILYSADGGATWAVVYRDVQAGTFEAVSVVEGRRVLAASEHGFVVTAGLSQ